MDFLQERQVYLTAFKHFLPTFTFKNFISLSFHQFIGFGCTFSISSLSVGAAAVSFLKCFHGLGLHFLLGASAGTLSRSVSNSAVALGLMYFTLSLMVSKQRVKKQGYIEVTCSPVGIFSFRWILKCQDQLQCLDESS